MNGGQVMLTSKQNNALKIMMALNEDEITTVRDLSSSVSLSVSYLESMVAVLRNEGLVKGTAGMYGGYSLSRSPSSITVADILIAFIKATPPHPVTKALTSVSLRDLQDSIQFPKSQA
ncbi:MULTISPECIES: Rrf2 family transcriptional regulator [unclassified Pantoea]|uniref:Rrf2 family transcriptional regulator n=1 Tax=unclassified Pantoea TaxID=2630326 RepID=UPI001CD36813|nr:MULTISPECIES: Rrf2 family transcriptional regulator [unclassified Pantoea]MCA1178883.1 Rrf2 family transcriptional regulator [Pantoea sp. alder69]MCA1253804.1 Rrf2 family transcriptional regulator [Pantoea sp. alder70]MCA1267372.1 Rrf2 family transcriptional regulator [Pantoea sp. alder81]